MPYEDRVVDPTKLVRGKILIYHHSYHSYTSNFRVLDRILILSSPRLLEENKGLSEKYGRDFITVRYISTEHLEYWGNWEKELFLSDAGVTSHGKKGTDNGGSFLSETGEKILTEEEITKMLSCINSFVKTEEKDCWAPPEEIIEPY